jgi:hypothetical protein
MPIEMICTRCRLSIQIPNEVGGMKVLCPQCRTASMVARFEPSPRASKEEPRSRKAAPREEAPEPPAKQPRAPQRQDLPVAPVKQTRPLGDRGRTGKLLLLGGGLGVLLLGCAGILTAWFFSRGRIDERLVGVWVFQPEPSRRLSAQFNVGYPEDLQDARWDFHANGTCVLLWGGEEKAGTWKKLAGNDRAVKVRITFADRTSQEVIFAFSDGDHVVVDPPLCKFRRLVEEQETGRGSRWPHAGIVNPSQAGFS